MQFRQGYALVVGVGSHKWHPELDNEITYNDAKAVMDVLRDDSACGYARDQLVFLHHREATKERILSAFDALAMQVGTESTVVVFFSGHGAIGTDGAYHLISHDARIVNERVLAKTGVSQMELLEKLRAIPAQRILLIFNACHSGTISSPLSSYRVSTSPQIKSSNPSDETAAALLNTGMGRVILTACRDDQVSYTGLGELTIFTQALVKGMRGHGVRNNNGFISAFNLYEYVYSEVLQEARSQVGERQEPVLSVANGVGPFAIALYQGAEVVGEFDTSEPLPQGTAVRVVHVGLGAWLQEHSVPLLLATVIIAIQGMLFFLLKDRVLVYAAEIQMLFLLLATFCLLGALWLGHQSYRKRMQKQSFVQGGVISLLFFLGWCGVWGGVTYHYFNQPTWEHDEFGVIIATFAQGGGLRAAADGYDVADEIYNGFALQVHGDRKLRESVRLRRLGVINSWSLAEYDGQRTNAKLVIWGFLREDRKCSEIHFKILQATDLWRNPAFPQMLPLTEQALTDRIILFSRESPEAARATAALSQGIAAFSLGLAHYYQRDFKEANELFEQALDGFDASPLCSSKDDANIHNLGLLYVFLGKSYQQLGDFTRSEQAYDLALAHDPHDVAALLGQSYNYLVKGNEELHQQTLQTVIQLTHNASTGFEAQATYDQALAYEALDKPELALAAYLTIVQEIDPTFFIAYIGAASALIKLERFAEAETMLGQGERYVAGNARREASLELVRGQLYEAWERADVAEQAYLRATKLDDSLLAAHLHLAQLYAAQLRLIQETNQADILREQAHSQFKILLNKSANVAWAHAQYAIFLSELGEHAAALMHYQIAVDATLADNSELLARLALAYIAAGDTSQAISYFEQALAKPSAAEAWIGHEYARALVEHCLQEEQCTTEELERAVTLFEHSMTVNDDFGAATRLNLGRLYEHELIGKREQAVTMYRSLFEACDLVESELELAQAADVLAYAYERLEALGVKDLPQCEQLPKG